MKQTPPTHSEPTVPQPQDTLVEWVTVDGTELFGIAAPSLLDENIFLALPIRKGNHYPRQKNYHGYYYFGQIGSHLWHESLLEAFTLACLDLHDEIVGIATQPMKMTFPDGSVHYPDIIAMHADQRQVVYDVKPAGRMTPEVVEQFAKTLEACKLVGWEYEVRYEATKQVEINVAWVAAFRHPGYYPGNDATKRLLTAMDGQVSIAEAIRHLALDSTPDGRSAVYHLVAARVLTIDLTAPLSDTTIVGRHPHAHA